MRRPAPIADWKHSMTLRSAVGILFGLLIIAVLSSLGIVASAQIKLWRIGWLDPGPPPEPGRPDDDLETFRKALSELGYVEHRNYVIESRFADTDWDRLPMLAKDLVDRGVDVIVTIGTPTVAAKAATTTIPIVMAGSEYPVEGGLVASLARPGGNVTGVTHSPGPEFAGKCLQLLKEAAPNIANVAVLWDSGALNQGISLDAQQAVARNLQLTLLPIDVKDVKSAEDFGSILFKIGEEHADALFIFPNFVNDKHAQAIVDFATARRLPSMFQTHSIVRKGGLISYYTDWNSLRRRAATYVDKILKGARPADLPVEQPSKLRLVINLKTANALGLTIPLSIMVRADEVIE
jgi:putative tryptophan/tyrosine transport system substrate-binding protein